VLVGDQRYLLTLSNQLLIQIILFIHPDVLFARVPEPPKVSGCGFVEAMRGKDFDMDVCPMGMGAKSGGESGGGGCIFSGASAKKHADLPKPEKTQSVLEMIMEEFMKQEQAKMKRPAAGHTEEEQPKCTYHKILPYIAWCAVQGIRLRRSEIPQVFQTILETKEELYMDEFVPKPKQTDIEPIDSAIPETVFNRALLNTNKSMDEIILIDSVVGCKLGLESKLALGVSPQILKSLLQCGSNIITSC
jgi:hypothetical protein